MGEERRTDIEFTRVVAVLLLDDLGFTERHDVMSLILVS